MKVKSLLRIGAEVGIVVIVRQRQGCAGAPAPEHLGGKALAFLRRVAMCLEEGVEATDPAVILAHYDEGAVPSENRRLGHAERLAVLALIAEDEFAGLDRPLLAWQRINAAALHCGLGDRIPETERVFRAVRRAEAMLAEQGDAAAPVEFGARRRQRLVERIIVDRVDGQREMAVARLEHVFPVFRRVGSEVAKLLRACGHALLERERKGLELGVGNAERLQTLEAERSADPEIEILAPIVGRSDMRCQPAEKIAGSRCLVEMEHGVNADIGFRPASEDQRLDVLQVERDAIPREVLF